MFNLIGVGLLPSKSPETTNRKLLTDLVTADITYCLHCLSAVSVIILLADNDPLKYVQLRSDQSDASVKVRHVFTPYHPA